MKIKAGIIIAAITCIMCIFPVSAYAAEKDTDFMLEKDYAACTFTVTFDGDGNYSGYITDTEGNEYQLISTDYSHLFCTVRNAKAGTWQSHIENSIGNIPDIKISVKATNAGEAYDPNQTIRVGLDIAELKVFFEDRDVVCDWNSSENDDVVVSVTSLDNNVILGKDTVRKGSHTYRCTIPEGTRTVTVSAVPAESAGIIGAERTFTLDVPEPPSAYVTFPEKTYTNQEDCSLRLVSGKDYGYEVVCEGKTIAQGTIGREEMELSVPLSLEGENSITVWFTDARANRTSFHTDINRDTQSPRLQFFTDYDGLTVSADHIIIEGKVFEYDSLNINGNAVIPATDGYFTYDCMLHEGMSDIIVTASDLAGNSTVFQFKITYVVPSSSGSKKVIACIVMIAVLAFGVYYFLIPKKKKDNSEPDADDIPEEKKSFLGSISARFGKNDRDDYRPLKNVRKRELKTVKDFENDFDIDPDDLKNDLEKAVDRELNDTGDIKGVVPVQQCPDDSESYEEDEKTTEDIIAPVQQDVKENASDLEGNHEDGTTVPASEKIPEKKKGQEDTEPKSSAEKKSILSFFRKEKKEKIEKEFEYVEKKITVDGEVRIEDYDENFDLSAKKNPNRKAKVEKAIRTKVEKQKEKAPETRKIQYRTSSRAKTKTFIGYCLFILMIWAVLTWVIQLGYVPTESMSPYIKAGDCYIGVRRLIFSNLELERGDIVAFRKDGEVLQKRIIGMPGDHISFLDGYVYINGEKLDESAYLDSNVHTNCAREYTVPEGCYFMLGDNRSDSFDSRYWQEPYIPYDDLQALCKLVIPTNSIFGLKDE